MNRHPTVLGSVLNSFQSIKHAIKGRNFKIQIGIAAAVLILSFVLGISSERRLILCIAILAVWASEFFNTAIEELGDAVTLEHHEGIGRAKELAAGGVLAVGLAAIVIGIWVFLPYLHF